MNPDIFTPDEQTALLQCLLAIKSLPIWSAPDFASVFGLSQSELRVVESSFPDWDFIDESSQGCDDSYIAITNAFAWFCNGTQSERWGMQENIKYDNEFMHHLHRKFHAM